MKLCTILIVTVLLTGCGAWVKASSPRSVTVAADTIRQAQEVANAECAKHQRFARFSQEHQRFNYTFDCVE